MDPFLLAEALNLVLENEGAAGIDGMTIEQVKKNSTDFIKQVCAEMKDKSFKPQAVRRVYIPKSDGRKRPLGIPTLKDRVIQRALVLILEPIYELKFKPCSYGFRPGKRAADCAAEVANATFKFRHVIDADINSFFDKVQHRKLMGMLKHEIVDPRILNLVKSFLQTGFVEKDKPWQASMEGTPQGGPLSPLLANIYLHYALDSQFEKWNIKGAHLIRYADDFVICSRTKTISLKILKLIQKALAEVGLHLKESKTRLVNMQNRFRSHDSYFDFLGFKFHLRAFKDNPKRFWIARQPSEKSRKNLTCKLKNALSPNLSMAQARQIAWETWNGWSEYFRYSNANRVFYRQIRTVKKQLARFLKRKYRRQRRPVPWSILYKWLKQLTQGFRPKRVINDLIRQQTIQRSLFDL